jgi:hypothetical protein
MTVLVKELIDIVTQPSAVEPVPTCAEESQPEDDPNYQLLGFVEVAPNTYLIKAAQELPPLKTAK